MKVFLSAGALGLLVAGQAGACDTSLPFHLRVRDCRLAASIADAAQRSPTLNSLIEAIQRSNALVFVVPPPNFGRAAELLGGVYDEPSSGGPYRILRLFVRNSGDAAAATFGHELRHVLETLDSPGQNDGLAIKARDGREAWQSQRGVIETRAALEAGEAIARELRANKRRGGRARPPSP